MLAEPAHAFQPVGDVAETQFLQFGSCGPAVRGIPSAQFIVLVQEPGKPLAVQHDAIVLARKHKPVKRRLVDRALPVKVPYVDGPELVPDALSGAVKLIFADIVTRAGREKLGHQGSISGSISDGY